MRSAAAFAMSALVVAGWAVPLTAQRVPNPRAFSDRPAAAQDNPAGEQVDPAAAQNDPAAAQNDSLAAQGDPAALAPGRAVEVRYGTRWYPGIVVDAVRGRAVAVEVDMGGTKRRRMAPLDRVRFPEPTAATSSTPEATPGADSADGPPDRQEMRTWTDTTGRFRIEATLVEQRERVVILRRPDGNTTTVPLRKLSEADQAWLRERAPTAESPSDPAPTTAGGDGWNVDIAELDFQAAPLLALSELLAPTDALIDKGAVASWPAGSTILGPRTPQAKGGRLLRLPGDEPAAIASWFDVRDRAGWGTVFARLTPGAPRSAELAFVPAQLDVFPGREGRMLALIASGGIAFKADTLYQIQWFAGAEPQPVGVSARFVNLPPSGPELVWAGQGAGGAVAVLASDGSLLLLDESLAPRVRVEGPRSAEPSLPAFSPGGKYLAVRIDRYVAIVDVKKGEVVAAWSANLQQPTFAFSPDGKYLACGDAAGVTVFDLASGDEKVRLPAPQVRGFRHAAPIWLGSEYVLCNNQLLVDVERGIPVWTYETFYSRPLAIAGLGSVVGYVLAPNQLGMVALQLPHPLAQQSITGMNPDEMFAIAPGGAVELHVDNRAGGTVETAQVKLVMEKAIADAGWQLTSTADAQVVVTIANGRPQASTFVPPLGGPGSSETVTYTPIETSISVVVRGTPAWLRGDTGTMPAIVATRGGETTQAAAARWRNVNFGFLNTVRLPQRIVAPQFAAGLGKSQVTMAGIQDR